MGRLLRGGAWFRPWLVCSLFPAVLLTLAACQSTEQRTDRLVRFVDELTFGGPFDAHKGKGQRLRRWTPDGMRVALGEGAPAGYEKRVEAILAVFTEETGTPAELVAIGKANLLIEFSREPKFAINREHVDCFIRYNSYAEGLVKRATISISLAKADPQKDCLAHEFMHAFGFSNHSAIVRSALSPMHQATELTTWDRLALRVLYHDRLRPRMDRTTALPVMQALIQDDGRAPRTAASPVDVRPAGRS